jgi:molybdopterin converting factor small subunit
VGRGEVQLDMPVPAELSRVLEQLSTQYPSLASELPRAACAVGDTLVRRDETVTGDVPLVLLPPVSGG